MAYEAKLLISDVVKSGTKLKQLAAEAVTGSKERVTEVVWNTLGWERSEVIAVETKGQGSPTGKKRKTENDGKSQTDSQGNKLGISTGQQEIPLATVGLCNKKI